jgi:murein DD-endopeptidase MepM/ murein hydrolase activator NlpD
LAKNPDTWSKRVLIKIIPHGARSIYKLELTHGHLAAFAACLVVLVSAFFAEHVTQVRAEEAKVKELQRVNAAQQQQLVNFSNQTNHMWRQLNEIQQAHQEIQRLSSPAATHVVPANAATNAQAPNATIHAQAPETTVHAQTSDASSVSPGSASSTAAGRNGGTARARMGVTPETDASAGTEHVQTTSSGPIVASTPIDALPLHGPWWAQAAAWLGVGRGGVAYNGVTFEGESESLVMLDAGMQRVYADTVKLKHEVSKVAEVREEAQVAYRRMLEAIPSIWPTDGSISSGFGYRTYPDVGFHTGLDIVNYYGAPIYATAAGIVTVAGWDGGFGEKIEIDHGNGYVTWYGHNSALLVNPGEFVHKGQQIARLGSTGFVTGPHVHYEVHEYGRPIDPVPFLSGLVGPQVPLAQFAQAR